MVQEESRHMEQAERVFTHIVFDITDECRDSLITVADDPV
jgi:hypothetical protein